MDTKTCPSCGADVPRVAKRCRECFHDLRDKSSGSASGGSSAMNGLLILVGALGIMSVLAAVALGTIVSFPLDAKIQVNKESQYVIITRQYVSGIKSERVAFSDIVAVKHVIASAGVFKIVAIQSSGSELVIAQADRSLKGDAEKYAEVMDKPFTEDDRTGGLLKPKTPAPQP